MEICNRLYEEKKGSCENLITLFMPTYNRASFIPRVYNSLLNQSSKQFVWLIVNDGSTDETDTVVQNFVKENTLPILYISKKNGGKHSAFEVALNACVTKYFICLDDDDEYSLESVEFFINKWKEIEKSEIEEIGAIRTLTKRQDGKIVADFKIVEGQEYDASTLEVNYIMNRHMENWTCYDTNKLKEIDLFPENYWMKEHHTFFTEAIWQGRFARKYKCRYVNKALCVYTDDAEVSLIRHKKNRQHYWNSFLNNKFLIDEQYDYMIKQPKLLLKLLVLVSLYRNYLGISFCDFLANTRSGIPKLLYTMAFPISFLSHFFNLPKE